MDIKEASRILKALYDGVDPFTGEIYEADSPFQNPDMTRALGLALNALQRQEGTSKRQQVLPGQAGKPWSEQEDKALLAAFDAGIKLAQLAKDHQRSRGAIQARLVRLGKIPVAGYKRAI